MLPRHFVSRFTMLVVYKIKPREPLRGCCVVSILLFLGRSGVFRPVPYGSEESLAAGWVDNVVTGQAYF